MLHGNFLVGYPSFMFRTADWRAKGGADERYRVASDYDLLCWLCSRGSMAITPSTHYVRRTHDSNVCNNKQRMFLDVAQVRAHYLTSQRWLLADEEISRPMRDWFGYFGYCLREAGNYRDAWRCYCTIGRVWGWNRSLAMEALKLPVCRIWRRLVRWAPSYSSLTDPGVPNQSGAAQRSAV